MRTSIPEGRSTRSLIPTATLALIGTVTLLSGCGRPAETAEETYQRIMNVEVTELAFQPFTSTINVTGTVEALYDVTIVAEEGGVVEEILVPKGAAVRKDQSIARMDAEVLDAQLDEARAAAELAEEQWQRQKRLWEEEKIGTELAYIQTRETARMRAATVQTMETRLAKKILRSPVDGTFEEHYVEVGGYAAPGMPFARVVSIDQVKIAGGVPERYAMDIRVGTTVEMMMDTCPEQPCIHEIDFVGDTVDSDSRTFRVELRIPNPNRVLKPGMIANMRIIRDQIDEAIVVPQEAVVRIEAGYQVFVVSEQEGRATAEARPVQLGPGRANQVVILDGLQPGERIVTVGQLKITDGDLLNVVEVRTQSLNGSGSR